MAQLGEAGNNTGVVGRKSPQLADGHVHGFGRVVMMVGVVLTRPFEAGVIEEATRDGTLTIMAWCTATSGPDGGSAWASLPTERRNQELPASHATLKRSS